MSHLRLVSGVVLIVVLTAPLLMAATPLAAASGPLVPDADADSANGGVLFIENAGQWPADARFQVWGGPGTLWLAQDAIWLTVIERSRDAPFAMPRAEPPESRDIGTPELPGTGVNLKLTFLGANPTAPLEPADPLTTTISYFLGNDPTSWRPAVPVWGEVRYAGMYPGVDLAISGDADGWTWQFRGQPEGLPNDGPVLRIEGAEGMTQDGATLRLATAAGEVMLPLPTAAFAYQIELARPDGPAETLPVPAGLAVPVPMSPQVPADDPGDLLYSTFLGGSGYDGSGGIGGGITVDAAGRAYVTGYTGSNNFPTTPGAFDPSYNGGVDAFVVRLNATGSALEYGTYLGGNSNDYGYGIAVDAAGRAYVTGNTASNNFPTTAGAFDPSHNGLVDAFVLRLNPAGSALEYGTYLGGNSNDHSGDITVDTVSRAYVTGWIDSSNFTTTAVAFDGSFDGNSNAFVVRLNATGSALEYSTLLGGSEDDYSSSIAVDDAGRAYVTGRTDSSNFPTTPGAFDRSFNGVADTFVVRLNAAGSALEYGTFLGGSYEDYGIGIAVDAAGRAYVTGLVVSSDFPTTPGTYDRSFNGVWDAFVVRLNAAGNTLEYSTFLGGSIPDAGIGIAVDAAGRAYVTGDVASGDFPTTPGAFDPSFNGNGDAFVVRLNAAGSTLEYASFLGGHEADGDGATVAIALDDAGRAYVTGYTESNNFPTTPGAFNRSYNGNGDAFVSKLRLQTTPKLQSTWHREAEAGILSGVMQRGSSSNASACQYVASNGAGTGDAVTFNLTVPYDDEYYLWARARGLDWTHNSFWVRVDGGEDVRFEIEPDLNGNWVFRWQAISSMTLSQQPFSLGTGTHTLRFQAREPRAQLDAVVLVNRANVVPTQVTPCNVTWRAYLPAVRR